MVKLVCGSKGTGKTKRMIEMANYDSISDEGDIVFIQTSNKHMLSLNHKIRYINAMEFDINNIENFHGFLCGIIAEDFDIHKIYIDGLYKIVNLNSDLLTKVIDILEKLYDKFNIEFILSMNFEPNEVPDTLKKHLLN